MDKCNLLAGVAVVGWVLTIIGWYVHIHHANNRETRKEIRSEIDKIIDEVEKLLKSSNAYYCCSKKNDQKSAEAEIYASFEKLFGIVERLGEFDPNIKLQKKIDDLYEAITSGDFGSEKVNRNGEIYTEKCQRFALLAENVRTASENWYREIFH